MQLWRKVSNVLPGTATSPDYRLYSACYLKHPEACEPLHSVNMVVMVNTVCKYVLSTALLGTAAF